MPATRSAPANDPSRAPIAGFLALVLPGLGHLYVGDRGRGIIFAVVISVTFWAGVAIGGVRTTVDLTQRKAWFLAQLCSGTHVLAVLAIQKIPPPEAWRDPHPKDNGWPRAFWPSEDIAVVYTGVAGLLNLLVILDVLIRAEGSAAPHGREPPDERRRPRAKAKTA